MSDVQPDPVIRTDESGVLRIGHTRVTLETLVAAFAAGATPEQFVQDFPVVTLAEAYSAIGSYLQRKVEFDAYLADRQLERQATLSSVYAPNVRERLLARRPARSA